MAWQAGLSDHQQQGFLDAYQKVSLSKCSTLNCTHLSAPSACKVGHSPIEHSDVCQQFVLQYMLQIGDKNGEKVHSNSLHIFLTSINTGNIIGLFKTNVQVFHFSKPWH